MRVLITKPRLDIPFKPSLFTNKRGGIIAIREYWQNLPELLAEAHRQHGHTVRILELPLWQISQELVDAFKPDRVYLPHRQRHQLGIDGYYYMQTVLPWIFTIDTEGWGANLSVHPLPADGDPDSGVFESLAERIKTNQSKFPQPDRRELDLPEQFIFFPCQLPHDETIRFHSDVKVEEVLQALVDWCQSKGIPLVVKGHPANPQSMGPLKDIAGQRCIWIDQASIHDLISASSAVYTVNSGVGLESILHGKPVVTFGRAEYQSVTIHGQLESLDQCWEAAQTPVDHRAYKAFIDRYVNFCVDISNPESFSRFVERSLA